MVQAKQHYTFAQSHNGPIVQLYWVRNGTCIRTMKSWNQANILYSDLSLFVKGQWQFHYPMMVNWGPAHRVHFSLPSR
jgi:hypothetical protein